MGIYLVPLGLDLLQDKMGPFSTDPFTNAYLSHLFKGIDEIGKVVVGLAEKKELKIKGIPILKMGFCSKWRLNDKWMRWGGYPGIFGFLSRRRCFKDQGINAPVS